MPEKNVPAPFGALPGNFLRGPEKSKNYPNFAYFPWWANGPYSTALGQWALAAIYPLWESMYGHQGCNALMLYDTST